jgi:hypothetical protein
MIVVGSLLVYIFISNFPEDAKFLSEEERVYVAGRINDDIGRTPSDKISVKVVFNILREWRIWCLYYPYIWNADVRGLMTLCHQVSQNGLYIFVPTILVNFGYTNIQAVLFTIPIHLCGIVWGIGSAILADKFQHRSTLLLISISISIVGFGMAGWALDSRKARLGGVFLASMGISFQRSGC